MPRILARQPEVRIIIVTGDGKLVGTFLRGSSGDPPSESSGETVCPGVFFSLGQTSLSLSLPLSSSLFLCSSLAAFHSHFVLSICVFCGWLRQSLDARLLYR